MRLISKWGPAVAVPVVVVAIAAIAPEMAAAQADKVTAQSCSFGSTWGDGLARWVFGIGPLLMLLGVLMALGGGGARSGGSAGGEIVGHAISGVAGIGIVMGLLGAVTFLATIAVAAAGGAACPAAS